MLNELGEKHYARHMIRLFNKKTKEEEKLNSISEQIDNLYQKWALTGNERCLSDCKNLMRSYFPCYFEIFEQDIKHIGRVGMAELESITKNYEGICFT